MRRSSRSKITIPDKELEKAFEWVKYNTEWLVRDVPEIGRGLGAGMPDYPWWFGVDNEYTLKGAIVTGRKDLVYQTIELIHRLSESNGNGRIVHEVSTNGVIFNPGNQRTLIASLIWWVYQYRERVPPNIPTIWAELVMEEMMRWKLSPYGYIHVDPKLMGMATYNSSIFRCVVMAMELEDFAGAESYQQTADLSRKDQ